MVRRWEGEEAQENTYTSGKEGKGKRMEGETRAIEIREKGRHDEM